MEFCITYVFTYLALWGSSKIIMKTKSIDPIYRWNVLSKNHLMRRNFAEELWNMEECEESRRATVAMSAMSYAANAGSTIQQHI